MSLLVHVHVSDAPQVFQSVQWLDCLVTAYLLGLGTANFIGFVLGINQASIRSRD